MVIVEELPASGAPVLVADRPQVGQKLGAAVLTYRHEERLINVFIDEVVSVGALPSKRHDLASLRRRAIDGPRR
jgi:hypothetical protein